MTDRLSGHDQAFLGDRAQPGVGALIMVDTVGGPLTLDQVTQLLMSRIDQLPRHRQIPVPVPGASPRWVDDPSFNIEQHLGRRDEIGAVDELHRASFSPGQPPWDATLIGQGEALYLRWHHAMVDGMSAIAIGRVLFDREPDPPIETPATWRPEPVDPDALVLDAAQERVASTIGVAWGEATAWLDPLAKLESDVAFLDGWLDIHDRVSLAPESRSGVSRFTRVDMMDQGEFLARSKAFPGGVEGVAVVTLASAVTNLLWARGVNDFDRPLRVLVPVARARRRREATLGNAATFFLLDVPLGLSSEATADDVADQIRRVKPLHTHSVSQMMDWLDVLSPDLVAVLSSAASRTEGIDAIVSYVRGPRIPLWLAGCPHLGTYSTLPTSGAVPLSFGVVGLGGRVSFSLSAVDGVYPEIDYLASRLRAGLASLAKNPG